MGSGNHLFSYQFEVTTAYFLLSNPQLRVLKPVQLRLLKERIKQEVPESAWEHLSMGMTNDYQVAIEEGATMIRIGRALFGERS